MSGAESGSPVSLLLAASAEGLTPADELLSAEELLSAVELMSAEGPLPVA